MPSHTSVSSVCNKYPKETGFTLVELLVVIGIIAILTAIAVPVFLAQRGKANDATLRAEMKNAAIQVETAMQDLGGYSGIYDVAGTVGPTIYLNADSGVNSLLIPNRVKFWNDFEQFSKIAYSKETYIEIAHLSNDVSSALWSKTYTDYEYCLFGVHANGGRFNFKWGGTAKDYDNVLLHDSRLGGLKTIDEIAPLVRGMTPAEATKVS